MPTSWLICRSRNSPRASSTGEVSPVEIAEAILTRVQRLNPRLNAYYTVFGDELVAAARNAESEIVRGAYRGPLHGIPVGIKDIYEYGVPRAAPSRWKITAPKSRRDRRLSNYWRAAH